MRKSKIDMKEPEIPRIPLKIIRKGNNIKMTVDRFSLELKPVDGYSQTYDFLACEQFVTKVAQIMYQKIIDREQLKAEVAKALKSGDKDGK